MLVGGQRHAPASLPREKARYQLNSRLGGPQGRSGRMRKILPHLVASRYTDYAIPDPTKFFHWHENAQRNTQHNKMHYILFPVKGNQRRDLLFRSFW
jgi:hypothetical protein